jgi:type I restriction enzyme M protein
MAALASLHVLNLLDLKMNTQAVNVNSSLIWSVADLLRGDFKQSDYGKIILPFTVLRRLDCVLEKTKTAVVAEFEANKNTPPEALDRFLVRKSGYQFYNTSKQSFVSALDDSNNAYANLVNYVGAFSENVRDVFERFGFQATLERLNDANLLYMVAKKFAAIDLHPDTVSNVHMGLMFEELIRKFAELSNETAGEHFTPRECIRLIVELLFESDDEVLSKPGIVRSIYDPTAGTGGMLSVAEEYLNRLNPDARLVLHGQELNPESYAICKADMIIKGQDIGNVIFGNTLSADGLRAKKFDYMLSNPPFGVEWKKIESAIRKEFESKGFEGRFGPGLPRVSDGSLLFLLHLISKMRPVHEGGSRIGIVLNGSPLFTGGAGSGESEIRKYIIENDLLETIVALPNDMFYNTGISTYIWILSNHKSGERKGKIQLINGADFYQKMRKSLGSKRKELGENDINTIVRLYGKFEENEHSKIFDNADFGYSTITVERPLKDESGKLILGEKGKNKGKPQPDSNLRDTENVPLKDDIEAYFKREVLPHVPDAWIDHEKTKVGYEIPFNRHFYKYVPPRPLEEIDAELKAVSTEIMDLLKDITA